MSWQENLEGILRRSRFNLDGSDSENATTLRSEGGGDMVLRTSTNQKHQFEKYSSEFANLIRMVQGTLSEIRVESEVCHLSPLV